MRLSQILQPVPGGGGNKLGYHKQQNDTRNGMQAAVGTSLDITSGEAIGARSRVGDRTYSELTTGSLILSANTAGSGHLSHPTRRQNRCNCPAAEPNFPDVIGH